MGDESRLKHEVFISYSKKDKQWADAACAVLERHWIRCWIAPRDVIPGTEWGAAIISGLDSSKIVVVIFSNYANQSAQVRREVERAIGKGMIVLPFRVEDVKPAGAMEYALSNTHWLDGFTKPVERQLDLLAGSVEALLGKGRGEVAGPPDISVNTPRHTVGPLLIAGGLAVLMAIILAGLFAMFRGRTVPPIAETGPSGDKPVPLVAATAQGSDQERIQGRWQLVEAVLGNVSAKGSANAQKKANPAQLWEFQGKHLTIPAAASTDNNDREWRGSYSLSAGADRKLFDFVGTAPSGARVEFLGIYEFEGEYLRFCYGIRRDQNDPHFKRPDSFAALPGTSRQYRKFRRLGER